jgi:hypothetical protein
MYGSTASSSPVICPYGGTPEIKSSTYSAPLTTVPEVPDGVNVTSITTVWPGLIMIGENGADGLVASSQRSPVEEVTAGSKAFEVEVMVIVAVPAGAELAYGPHSVGPADQIPAVTVPPGGL